MDVATKLTERCKLMLRPGVLFLAWLSVAAACTENDQPPSDASVAFEEPASQTGWQIPLTASFVIQSAATQNDFQVTVAVPRGYAESSANYPVLYVLDANWALPVAVETARILAIGPKENPTGDLREEPIIVGIGYPVGLYWNAIPPRLRDFTPAPDTLLVAEIANAIGFAPEDSGSGGADAFLGVLTTEIMPAVEEQYRIDKSRRALFGHSLGGLFASFVLFSSPELFNSFLIACPALDLDHDVTWNLERTFAMEQRDLPARVFLSCGSLDVQYTAVVRELDLVFQARKYPSLVWQTEIFPGETHSSVGALSLTRGIRWLYGDLMPKP